MHYSESSEIKTVQLIAGTEIVPLTTGVTIEAGAGILPAGSVLGRNETTGKCRLVDSASTGGSEKPLFVLPQEVDASSEDVFATAYKTGIFIRDALKFGGSDTAETHEAALRLLNIHMRQNY